MKLVLSLLFLLISFRLATAEAPAAPPGFDPQRHMRVSEVKPGMKGYGLSVFFGDRIDRFEVEVISILRNFNPRQDVILIRATGQNLEHTGAIAGMSGSPIYLRDAEGRDRLIGAFAYGWPMMKDPLAGVQPIEYMLAMPLQAKGATSRPATLPAGVALAGPEGRWHVLASLTETKSRLHAALAAGPKPRSADLTQLRPLMVPLSASGIGVSSLQQLSGAFEPLGLAPLQAGSGGASRPDVTVPLAPGSVMAIPLLTGDIDLTAVGTCTEVLGDKAYGFGHPFTSEGPVSLPMCGGRINGIIANLVTSFKLGEATAPQGTLLADQTPGVAGQLGESAATAPLTLRVRYADQSLDQNFRFNAVIHPHYTPLLASTAMFGAVSASHELPRHNTLRYEVTATFLDGHTVKLRDTLANVNPAILFGELGSPLTTAADNPFARVLLKELKGELIVWEGTRQAELLSAGVPRQVYRPGETVRFFVGLRPFRGIDLVHPLEFKIPADLPEGSYVITVSDLGRYLTDERTYSPFRFTAANIDDVFAAINEVGQLQSDAFYLRLVRTDRAVAIGRTAMPQMPGTRRRMLLNGNRADVVAYTPSVTAILPSQWVLSGSAELPITVSTESRQIPLGATAAEARAATRPAVEP